MVADILHELKYERLWECEMTKSEKCVGCWIKRNASVELPDRLPATADEVIE
jgi:hypothetical protein